MARRISLALAAAVGMAAGREQGPDHMATAFEAAVGHVDMVEQDGRGRWRNQLDCMTTAVELVAGQRGLGHSPLLVGYPYNRQMFLMSDSECNLSTTSDKARVLWVVLRLCRQWLRRRRLLQTAKT